MENNIPELPSIKTLACNAVVKRITTTTDAGFDVTLSISEIDFPLVQELIKMKSNCAVLAVAFQEITGENRE